jgi:hypothetical protein
MQKSSYVQPGEGEYTNDHNMESLYGCVLRRKKDEALNLPPKHLFEICIHMSAIGIYCLFYFIWNK